MLRCMFVQNLIMLSAAFHRVTEKRGEKKLRDDAENNTAVAFWDSKIHAVNYHP